MPKKDRERTSKREKKSEKQEFVVERIEQRWQAEDDLKLKIAIEQLHDLELVHNAVTFSCYFTLSEIEDRWRKLLTGKNVAAAASSEISALSLNAFKKAVKESCLFSEKENEIIIEEIGAIKDPSLGYFARFLNSNAARFHSCRTPASLYEQWKLLYKYRLHNDQTLPHPSMSLQHQDVLTLDLDLNEIDYETHHRLRQQRAEMQKMHEILNTMELIQKYKEEEKEKVKSAANGNKSPCDCPRPAAENGRRRPCACRPPATAVPADEAPNTLPAIPRKNTESSPDKLKKYCAHIYGDFTSFYFPDELDQITIGRGDVDVDLTKEIGSSRVNRRQCLISKSVEKSKNVFLLRNCGDRPVIVDGLQIGPNATSWLSYNSLIQVQMRPLHGDETKAFFEKLANYIGSENIKRLLERSDGKYQFILHKERVYYASEDIVKKAGSCARENLISVGVCFGKFTKTKKFRLQITALDYLAPYAQFKVWLKASSEQSFLYGNHVLKSGLGRVTENTDQYQGVVVYTMNDVPLGFGVAGMFMIRRGNHK